MERPIRPSAAPLAPDSARKALVLALGLALAAAGCGSGERDGPRPASGEAATGAAATADLPNVLLVTFDALRADRLGCYGYPRPTSPRLDAFARRATLYRRAFAASPWTLPSHASLFTGKFPFEHGARTFETGTRGNNVNPLDPDHLTLAEVLQETGYRTAAFVANTAYLGKRWLLDQGFEVYQPERVRAFELNRRILSWLRRQRPRPFFLFVNYMDTHRPYNTQPVEGFLDPPAVRDGGALLDSLYAAVMPASDPVPTDLARKVIDQYDTSVRNVDAGIAELLDALAEMGLLDDMLIVLTSDHGEYFGEHHLVEHSKDIYQEVLWVPLLVRTPGQQAGRVSDEPIAGTDLTGLILEWIGGPAAARADSFPDRPGNHPVLAENYYTRDKDLFHPVWGHRFRRVRLGLIDWPWKLILSSDGRNELFQLEQDPAESTNLIDAQPGRVAEYQARIAAFGAVREQATRQLVQPPLTEMEREQLRSLGYIGD